MDNNKSRYSLLGIAYFIQIFATIFFFLYFIIHNHFFYSKVEYIGIYVYISCLTSLILFAYIDNPMLKKITCSIGMNGISTYFRLKRVVYENKIDTRKSVYKVCVVFAVISSILIIQGVNESKFYGNLESIRQSILTFIVIDYWIQIEKSKE